MNFIEAMNKVHSNPAGPTAVAVARRGWENGFIFYDATLFLGIQPFGFRWSNHVDSSGNTYSPTPEDINATDWEVIEL